MAITPDQVEQAKAALSLLATLLPEEAQPYVRDLATDLPLGFATFTQVKEAIAKFPPRAERTVVSIVDAFGIPAGTPAHTLAELIDAVEHQIEAEIEKGKAAPALPPGA